MKFCQVGDSVNVKYTDGKFYGAFISRVNQDGTYGIYFLEDSISMKQVSHDNIKKPITKGRTACHWSKYFGKLFSDDGGTDEKTGTYFEPGEFVVKSVTDSDNFICRRLTGNDGMDTEDVEFDIGYVVYRIRKYDEE